MPSAFHVPAQRTYKGGDDDHKQHVLNCAVEIHQPSLKQLDGNISHNRISKRCKSSSFLKTSRAKSVAPAIRLFFARIQLVERALQFFKLLSSLAELAFRCQTLVVGKVFGGFGDG